MGKERRLLDVMSGDVGGDEDVDVDIGDSWADDEVSDACKAGTDDCGSEGNDNVLEVVV